MSACGSPARYRWHIRHGEEACKACKKAHADALSEWRKRPAQPPRRLKPCGSQAAFERHLRRREPACAPCLRAHADYVAKWARSKRAAA